MKKEIIPVYCCTFCSRIGRYAGPMSLHERRCKKNPHNQVWCYTCANFIKSETTRKVYGERELPGGGIQITNSEFPSHRCKASNEFLYNGVKLWLETKDDLGNDPDASWKEMPDKTTTCPNYKQAEEEGGAL
jgi:hypothetical protein